MNIAVILAGGTGSRLGGSRPKQYREVNKKPVIRYCLDRFAACEVLDAMWIVADAAWHGYIREHVTEAGLMGKLRGFSRPGENRQLSIYNALTDILEYAAPDDYVMIHDAVRPMVKSSFIEECFMRAGGHDGVLPVLPMKDTVYLSKDGRVVRDLLDRARVFAGQAPEVFLLGRYYEANRALLPEKILDINGAAEPAVMAGMDIVMIPGDEGNFKITTPEDLRRFERIQGDVK